MFPEWLKTSEIFLEIQDDLDESFVRNIPADCIIDSMDKFILIIKLCNFWCYNNNGMKFPIEIFSFFFQNREICSFLLQENNLIIEEYNYATITALHIEKSQNIERTSLKWFLIVAPTMYNFHVGKNNNKLRYNINNGQYLEIDEPEDNFFDFIKSTYGHWQFLKTKIKIISMISSNFRKFSEKFVLATKNPCDDGNFILRQSNGNIIGLPNSLILSYIQKSSEILHDKPKKDYNRFLYVLIHLDLNYIADLCEEDHEAWYRKFMHMREKDRLQIRDKINNHFELI